jgi:hypothetical protein
MGSIVARENGTVVAAIKYVVIESALDIGVVLSGNWQSLKRCCILDRFQCSLISFRYPT